MPIADEVALNAYITAVNAREVAQVCARHVEGFRQQFEQDFASWSRRNAQEISRGDALATAKGWNSAGPASVQRMAQMEADLIERLPADDRTRRCSELVARLAPAPQK
ncbi:hypothetical protein [Inhella proteolytica]|uniref:Uncharacterized protein n=1 Tax=Inhella proteolytica TaxID=2795029 RepID=A0A931NJC3_9BURK|nr:hypothetical protein [Inhella proteolytica]MBH9578495.1 hypothetical protein [Inhella proteolytica]